MSFRVHRVYIQVYRDMTKVKVEILQKEVSHKMTAVTVVFSTLNGSFSV